jgi:hypothetical protein
MDDKSGPGVRPCEGDRAEELMVSVATVGAVDRSRTPFLGFPLALGRWLIVVSPVLLELATVTGAFSSIIPSASSASVMMSA